MYRRRSAAGHPLLPTSTLRGALACASKECGSVKKRMPHRAAICTTALLVTRSISWLLQRRYSQLVFGAAVFSTEYGFPWTAFEISVMAFCARTLLPA